MVLWLIRVVTNQSSVAPHQHYSIVVNPCRDQSVVGCAPPYLQLEARVRDGEREGVRHPGGPAGLMQVHDALKDRIHCRVPSYVVRTAGV